MRSTRILALLAVGALGGTAACAADKADGPAAGGSATGPIAVKATDTGCEIARTTLDAGTHVFTVTNSGAKVTEFYVYAAGDRVMGEVENIAPGLSRELHVELPAGSYEAACKPGMSGKGIRSALTVSGSAAALTDDAKLADATASYTRYVKSQTAALLPKTEEFVAAVKAGEVDKAKALFPVTRTYWERIEPVAEIFGDLDPKIDGREEVVEEGMKFTGFHRLEKDLWSAKPDLSDDGPIADQLLVDVKEIVARANAEKLSPLQLANGAKELLDEVATGKITGEEDRYSHTDLSDFLANVTGSQTTFGLLAPALKAKDPQLETDIAARFDAVQQELKTLAPDGSFPSYDTVDDQERQQLSDLVAALAKPLKQVSDALGQ